MYQLHLKDQKQEDDMDTTKFIHVLNIKFSRNKIHIRLFIDNV